MDKKEYIERDELFEIIAERNRNTCNGNLSCLQMKRMVENIPAADVAEVVHGEWIPLDEEYDIAKCGICGEVYEVGEGPLSNRELFSMFREVYNFCPNCGAKMDGGGDR